MIVMEDVVGFKKKISSLINRCKEGNVCITNFCDEAEVSIIEELIKDNGIRSNSYGGIINASRLRYIFSPYEVSENDYKINVYMIIYNKKFYDINHRSILGSLMSLGIKRECIGDIIILDSKDAYFSCTNEISPFIEENFKSIGKASIKLKQIDYPIENKIKYETKVHFLSSLRLDVAIAGVYGFSRNEVLEILERGDVYLNQILNQNPSHILKEDDIISVRHKGKFKIIKIGGNSKSGRYIVEIGKRI